MSNTDRSRIHDGAIDILIELQRHGPASTAALAVVLRRSTPAIRTDCERLETAGLIHCRDGRTWKADDTAVAAMWHARKQAAASRG